MTNNNDTDLNIYDQLKQVTKCIDSLKDVYENIPSDDRYASVFSLVGEKLELEFDVLSRLVLLSHKLE